MQNKLNKAEEKILCNEYVGKIKTISELAIKYKLTSTSICNYLKKNNILIIKGKNLDAIKDKIIKYYLDYNEDIVSISKRFNVNSSSIHRLLIRHGVKMKDSSKVRQIFSINENYFDKIDSESKSYFLGLLYADGCMSKSKYQTNISLQEQDKYILELFMKEMGYGGSLKYIDRYKKNKESHQIQYSFTISNKRIYERLLKLGMFPNKSLTLKFPNTKQVPKKFINHFIRGYFDGDGCTTKTPSGQKYISFLGTFEFLSKIKNCFLKNNLLKNEKKNSINKHTKDSKIYIFKVGGNKQIIPIISFLYKNSNFFLNRKKEKLLK